MKTICVYHNLDLDGWMSAAIVKKYWLTNLAQEQHLGYQILSDSKISESNSDNPKNIINFIGYNYGQPIPDLTDFDKVVMCDISFPKDIMDKLRAKLGPNFIWIDHHISAINDMQYSDKRDFSYCAGLRDTKFAACELTWKYFFPNEEMSEIVRLLGLYDTFRHKNTDEEQKVLEFQYGARERITDYKSAYDVLCITKDEKLYMGGQYFDNYINQIYDAGKAIYRYLCTDAKQSYKNGFEITFDFTTLLREQCGNYEGFKFICINKERFNPINFGIDYHKEGYDGAMCFHIDNNKTVCISLYNDNGEVDCSAIAKSFGGGGHKGAAGCRMTLEQFNNLIK